MTNAHALMFSDITASSWRQGEALVRQFLGPVKHVNQSHSPPTRDMSKNSSSVDNQPLTSVFVQSNFPTTATSDMLSQTHGSDILCDGLEHGSVDAHREPEATSSVSFDGHSTGEIMDVKDNASAQSVQHQQLPAAADASDVNVTQPSAHHISIFLPGNILISCGCIEKSTMQPEENKLFQ